MGTFVEFRRGYWNTSVVHHFLLRVRNMKGNNNTLMPFFVKTETSDAPNASFCFGGEV